MRNNVNSVWTIERIERLIELQKRRWSCSQIAAELGGGISRNSVIGKLHRMGITGGVVALSEQERIQRSRKAIARKVERQRERRREYRASNPAPARAPIPLMTCLDVTPRDITLLGLQPGECRYPTGEGSEITFCGHAILPGRSYCAPHARLCINSDRAWSKAEKESALRERRANHNQTILEAAE